MSHKRKATETKDSLDEQIEKKRRVLEQTQAELEELEKQKTDKCLAPAKARLASRRIEVLGIQKELDGVDDEDPEAESANTFFTTVKKQIEEFTITKLSGSKGQFTYTYNGGLDRLSMDVSCDLDLPMTADGDAHRSTDDDLEIDLHKFHYSTDDRLFGFKYIVEKLDEQMWLAVMLAHLHVVATDPVFDRVNLRGFCDEEQAKQLESELSEW